MSLRQNHVDPCLCGFPRAVISLKQNHIDRFEVLSLHGFPHTVILLKQNHIDPSLHGFPYAVISLRQNHIDFVEALRGFPRDRPLAEQILAPPWAGLVAKSFAMLLDL